MGGQYRSCKRFLYWLTWGRTRSIELKKNKPLFLVVGLFVSIMSLYFPSFFRALKRAG